MDDLRWGRIPAPGPERPDFLQKGWERTKDSRQPGALPYYMTYPLPASWREGEGEEAVRDLEYFIQMYPRQVKRYQRQIGKLLDALEYQGSVLYDEFPDQLALLRLSDEAMALIFGPQEGGTKGNGAAGNGMEENGEEGNAAVQSREAVRDLIQVLLCDEMFRRRRRRKPAYPSLWPQGGSFGLEGRRETGLSEALGLWKKPGSF